MFKLLKDNRGQSVAIQYALTFFLVAGISIAMSMYVKRSLQARIHDARDYMLQTVMDEVSGLPANYLVGNLYWEYEPYYANTEAIRSVDASQITRNLPSRPLSSGTAIHDMDRTATAISNSQQVSPREAR